MATPTTYKDVVETFRTIATNHLAVKQFQVGELSDLDIQNEQHPFQRFPLVFMIPRTSEMDRFGKLTLGFTFHVCDIAEEQEALQINTHNNCLMIMQDIFSKVLLTSAEELDLDIETPIFVEPYFERFNNCLYGWAAEINVIVSSPFNLCESAFAS